MRSPSLTSTRTRFAAALAAWGSAALVISVVHVGYALAGIVAGSFVLLGPGVALVLALGLHRQPQLALALALSVGFGASAATLFGHALILMGSYTPSGVVALQLALTLVIVAAGRAADV